MDDVTVIPAPEEPLPVPSLLPGGDDLNKASALNISRDLELPLLVEGCVCDGEAVRLDCDDEEGTF